MPADHSDQLARIKRFDQLIAYLRDSLGWPIHGDDFEELTFEYTADELGIDAKNAAKIQEIKRLRPLSPRQPWGIFFVKFEPKRLPVVALRRLLSQVALKKRASANSAERAAWAADDLLFVSNYGDGDERQISFAHFSKAQDSHDLPTLKVLGWDNLDTALHLDDVAKELTEHLCWPEDEADLEGWRQRWGGAFTLRHREVVVTSQQLSIRLAELARAIRDRINAALAIETERGPLTKLMKAFQEALVHDLDADGFADMYAQTIAYGLLSARIADPDKKTADDFAGHMRTNPFLRELMQTFLKVGGRRGKAGGSGIDFDELGVNDVVELLDNANMEAVVRDFGDRNPLEDPVVHFYEDFLRYYDPTQKKQRGVFYTPRPVVSYIVRSVDELLRTEFGLADGLADTTTWGEMAKRQKGLEVPEGIPASQAFVQILDPATGTGTFLVEVIDVIHKTLLAKWKVKGCNTQEEVRKLWNEYVPTHLLPRLYGYELLMAPYAIAHLKVGLKLYETGYRFGSDERAHIYLTNTLEPAHDFSGRLEFAIPALAHEVREVNAVKREQPFTVVVGNPPYAGVSSNMSTHAQGLVDAYRTVDGVPLKERKLWLQDDYVKFIRKAQTTIDLANWGVLGYITNHGYLDNPTFRGVRQSLMGTFTRLRVLDLHGNANKKERSPDGSEDKNVFDIRQGVAICLATRSFVPEAIVGHTELHGSRETKYSWLIQHSYLSSRFQLLTPQSPFYFFEPQVNDLRAEYEVGLKLTEAMPCFGLGFQSSRDHLVVAFSHSELTARIETFISRDRTDADIRGEFFPGKTVADYAPGDTRQWSLSAARRHLRGYADWPSRTRQCLYRPFDWRVVLYDKSMVDWPRPEVLGHMLHPNVCLLANRQSKEKFAVLCSKTITERKIAAVYDASSSFPLYLYADRDQLGLSTTKRANFSEAFLRKLAHALGNRQTSPHGLPSGLTSEEIFAYIYSVFHSPTYRERYAELLAVDFPCVPFPSGLDVLRELARLGGELIALHLLESTKIDTLITTYTGPSNPEVGRVGWSDDTVWLDAAATKKGKPATPGTIGFHGVPEAVWNFHIGGYQVCEKWLKDRKGRRLSKADITHYQKIVVALAETIRLMKEIDEVIERHGGWPAAFQTGQTQAGAAPAPIRFRPSIVEPELAERYVTCVPLVPLEAAAGAFGDPQHIDDDGWEWTAVDTKRRLRPGMFVAQVVGKSMEPAIPDGAYCLFAAPVTGTRQGKTILVQLRDATDPDTRERYTVKRYESTKAPDDELWTHAEITLKPLNPGFEPIVLDGADEGQLQIIAEVVEVLGS